MGNAYERKLRESLFGGLVHSHVKHIDAKLSLPELPDTTNPAFLGLKVPAFAEVYICSFNCLFLSLLQCMCMNFVY